MKVKSEREVAQSCPTLSDRMDCSLPLEWVSFPSPGDLLDPGVEPTSPALQVDSLLSEPPGWGSCSKQCGHSVTVFWEVLSALTLTNLIPTTIQRRTVISTIISFI